MCKDIMFLCIGIMCLCIGFRFLYSKIVKTTTENIYHHKGE